MVYTPAVGAVKETKEQTPPPKSSLAATAAPLGPTTVR
jgi:hypothetical protein